MRVIHKYEKKRWGEKSKAEKWGVDKTDSIESRDFLFLGSGRTGSQHISAVMKHWGYDVGHETTGLDGTSTHFFHADNDWYPMYPWTKHCAHRGERLSDFEFKYRIHVIRNPLSCIPSIMKIFTTLEWEFAEDTGLLPSDSRGWSKLQRVMFYWLNFNLRAEQQCETFMRTEELFMVLPKFMKEVIGQDVVWPEMKHKNRGTGFRKSVPTTYSDLYAEFPVIARGIRSLAKRYGYDV